MKPWDERTAFMATSKWYKHNLSGLCQSKNDICPWPLSTPLTDPDLVGAGPDPHITTLGAVSDVSYEIIPGQVSHDIWHVSGENVKAAIILIPRAPGSAGTRDTVLLADCHPRTLTDSHLIVQHQTWKIRARPIRRIILSRRKVQFVLNTSVSSSITIYYV